MRETAGDQPAGIETSGGSGHLRYRPHLDGLRAVAVYLVVAFHAGISHAGGGFIGVDTFFVLSGFLVTMILVRDLADFGRVQWRRFYSRRVRRILPAALVTLLVTALVYAAVASPLEKLDAFGGVRAAFFYVANWYFIHQATDYFAANVNTNPVLHFWSLAVEEQFYFLWPLLLTGCYLAVRRLGRLRWWALRAIVVCAGAASAIEALRIGTSHLERAYYGTDTRAYQLLAGALLALTPQLRKLGPAIRPAARRVAAVALVALVFLATSALNLSPITRGVATVVVVTILIVALENARGGWAKRMLSSRPFTYLGRISYGTYLWHWPIIVLITRSRSPAPIWLFVVAGGGATVLAAISFRLLERPIRTAPALDRFKTPVIAIGFTTSILIGALLIPPILDSSGGSTVAATGTSKSGLRLLDWRRARQDIPSAPDCLGKPVSDCLVVRGTGPNVVLVGDSNALMWLPAFEAIAKRESWNLTTAVKTTCAWQPGLVFNFDEPHEPLCSNHQADWFDRVIPEVDPDIVILVERSYDDPHHRFGVIFPDGRDREFGDLHFESKLIDASLPTIASLHKQGRKVVILEPIQDPFPLNPLQCLSDGTPPAKCTFTRDSTPTGLERAFRQEAAKLTDVWSLNLDRLVCPRLPTCDAEVGNIIVYRDGGHITKTFALSQADAIEQLFTKDRIVTSLPPYVPAG